MIQRLLVFLILTTTLACQNSKQNTSNNKEKMSKTTSNSINVDSLATQLISKVKSKGFKVIADVDHAVGAAKVDLQLRPTRTLIFGNPLGGTKLMQQDQTIGIDLPLKILIWEDENGASNLSYFNGSELTSRYGITEPQAVIEKVNGALADFTGVTKTNLETKNIKDRLITKQSEFDADATFLRLKETVTSKGLTIMAEVSHDKAAASVDLELRPTRLLIFGNPKVGTLLMQSNQEIGLDLPLKVLVHENENGDVFVSYFDATFLAERHNTTDKAEVITKVNGALNGITDVVISE